MFRKKALALSASLLAVTAAGCSQYKAGNPVRVTRNSADVASCQKVSDLNAGSRTAENEVVGELANQARERGADTVVLADGARTGSAYRCSSPNVAAR